jgi:hypothetical protein
MVHHFPMIARAQDGGGPASDRLFVASTGLRYLARNWKFESISLQGRVSNEPMATSRLAGEVDSAFGEFTELTIRRPRVFSATAEAAGC